MGIEFELKYRADAGILQQLLQDIYGQEQCYEMQTTYYDTPSRSFSEKKCTLRRRLENDRSICTLKTPAAGHGRREWEVECQRIEDAIEMLCKLGAPQDILAEAEKGLIPICGAKFTRIAKTIRLEDGCVELALDQGILTGGGRQIPLCEVEIELKEGNQALCLAYANHIAAIYHLTPEPLSKFRRALDLCKGE